MIVLPAIVVVIIIPIAVATIGRAPALVTSVRSIPPVPVPISIIPAVTIIPVIPIESVVIEAIVPAVVAVRPDLLEPAVIPVEVLVAVPVIVHADPIGPPPMLEVPEMPAVLDHNDARIAMLDDDGTPGPAVIPVRRHIVMAVRMVADVHRARHRPAPDMNVRRNPLGMAVLRREHRGSCNETG